MDHDRVFLLMILLFSYKVTAKKQSMSRKVTSILPCDIAKDRYDTESKAYLDVWNIKRGKMELFNANLTVPKTTLPVKFSLHGYRLEGKNKRPFFEIENLSCQNPLIKSIMKSINFKFNNDCSLKQGSYIAKDVNVNKMSESGEFILNIAGKYSIMFELKTRSGYVLCTDTLITVT